MIGSYAENQFPPTIGHDQRLWRAVLPSAPVDGPSHSVIIRHQIKVCHERRDRAAATEVNPIDAREETR